MNLFQGDNKVFKYKLPIMMLLILALFTNNAFTKEVKKTGTTAAKFLSIGIGPRANSMGGAFSSIGNDPSAMYWNPAGIAYIERNEAMFTYTKLFADLNLNYFGVVVPAGELGTFGVNVTAVNYGEMNVTTEDYPEGTGEVFSAASYSFGLTYAKSITEDFVVGVNIKYIREDIFNSSASGFCFDVGTIFKTPFYGIRFSSNISNYGSKMKMEGEDLLIRYDPDPTRAGNNQTLDAYYKTDEFELPLRLQVGISKDFELFEGQRFTLAVDAIHPNDNSQYINVGGELALFEETVSLRAGYRTIFMQDTQEGLTLGVGLCFDKIFSIGGSLDYSYQKYEYLGNTHSFGVVLKF